MAIRLDEDLAKAAAQQTLLAQQEAETRVSETFGIEEARKLADVMKGKLYLSDEELRVALAREAEETKAKPSERRTAATSRGTETAMDEVAAREITEVARPVSLANETAEMVVVGAAAKEERENNRNAQRTSLMQIALAATLGGSDRGDQVAISRLKDLIEHVSDPERAGQDILNAVANVEKAKAGSDSTYKYKNLRGQTVTVETSDDGNNQTPDTTYTVEQEYTGGIFADSGSTTASRRRGGILAAATTLGVVAALSSETGREGLQKLVSGGVDMPLMNPFTLASPQTPAQERIQDLGLYLA